MGSSLPISGRGLDLLAYLVLVRREKWWLMSWHTSRGVRQKNGGKCCACVGVAALRTPRLRGGHGVDVAPFHEERFNIAIGRRWGEEVGGVLARN